MTPPVHRAGSCTRYMIAQVWSGVPDHPPVRNHEVVRKWLKK
jgi:hypothetical protein